MITINKSMKPIYQLIEKIKRTNIEIEKFHDEKIRQNKLTFYKELIEKNMLRQKIKIIFTFYHVKIHRPQTP